MRKEGIRTLNDSAVKFIIARVIDNANHALEEQKKNPNDDFYHGKCLAYYEILDSIKNDLIIEGEDLKEFGLNINLEKKFL